MKNPMLTTLLVAVVVGLLSFFGGVKYQQSKQPNFPGSFEGRGNGRFMMRGSGPLGMRGSGFRPVEGEILSSDDASITVKLPDGSTKIVIVSESTQINKASEGQTSDLVTGSRVMVVGKENSDGSVTAENIQLNPMMRLFGGSGASGVNR